MKKLLLAGIVAAAFCSFAEMKIVTADLLKLVKSHPQHEANKTLVKSTAADYRKKMDGMQEQLKAIIEEGRKIQEENSSPMLSDKAKAEARKKLEGVQRRLMAQQQDMRAADQRFQEELQDLETRLVKIETEDVRKKVEAYAKEKGYDMILDKNACAFVKDMYDITDALYTVVGGVPPVAKKDNK